MKINKMEIWAWLKKQDYETEYMSYNGNSEFKMYYELDMPDILHAYYEWKKAEEKNIMRWTHIYALKQELEDYEKSIMEHDKATDAWQALRIHGEFIKGFDELTTIGPCISIFGSARTQPDDEFYQKATKLSELIVSNGYGIITGGGPGIMEAANLGASNLNGNSVGLQIELPFESSANEYVDKLVSCRYFFTRKVFFLKYSQAFVAFPGGFGTFDEIFETLTLIQTGHMRSVPIVFMDSNFWGGLFEWIKNTMLSQGKISKEDLEMYKLVDSPEEAMEYILSKLNTNAPNF